jgi:kumamolisin
MEIVPSIISVAVVPSVGAIPTPGYITPPQIATAYNIPASTGAGTKVGVISLGGGWLQSDLNSSMTDLGLTLNTPTQVLLDGATGTFSGNYFTYAGIASVENTLELYCVAAMVPDADITIYIGINSFQSFANCINAAVNDNCDVITISWGASEYYVRGDPLSSALANAAAKGISVFVASGDFGSSSNEPSAYISAGYPASNLNVVGVGGTYLVLGAGNVRVSESASTSSGGGISSRFSLPNYQQGLTYQTYSRDGNLTGPVTPLPRRGVPDIAAPMERYVMYFNGAITTVRGTSAGTPVLAGMIARFTELNGSRPITLKPTFYANPSAFYNLTTGNNASYPTNSGYMVTPGWDPVTGLGAPNGEQLYTALTSGSSDKVKDNLNQWQSIQSIQVKTDTAVWSTVQSTWVKIDSTDWIKVS